MPRSIPVQTAPSAIVHGIPPGLEDWATPCTKQDVARPRVPDACKEPASQSHTQREHQKENVGSSRKSSDNECSSGRVMGITTSKGSYRPPAITSTHLNGAHHTVTPDSRGPLPANGDRQTLQPVSGEPPLTPGPEKQQQPSRLNTKTKTSQMEAPFGVLNGIARKSNEGGQASITAESLQASELLRRVAELEEKLAEVRSPVEWDTLKNELELEHQRSDQLKKQNRNLAAAIRSLRNSIDLKSKAVLEEHERAEELGRVVLDLRRQLDAVRTDPARAVLEQEVQALQQSNESLTTQLDLVTLEAEETSKKYKYAVVKLKRALEEATNRNKVEQATVQAMYEEQTAKNKILEDAKEALIKSSLQSQAMGLLKSNLQEMASKMERYRQELCSVVNSLIAFEQGGGVNESALFGPNKPSMASISSPPEPDSIGFEIDRLRQFLADKYVERAGNECTTQ